MQFVRWHVHGAESDVGVVASFVGDETVVHLFVKQFMVLDVIAVVIIVVGGAVESTVEGGVEDVKTC